MAAGASGASSRNGRSREVSNPGTFHLATRGRALLAYLSSVMGISEWHIITCEYPPQSGGVSDYTQQVARGLADAGDRVHVWCPSSLPSHATAAGIDIHRVLGNIS